MNDVSRSARVVSIFAAGLLFCTALPLFAEISYDVQCIIGDEGTCVGFRDFVEPTDVAVDASGNVLACAFASRTAFRIGAYGLITQIFDEMGAPHLTAIAAGAGGVVYVGGHYPLSDRVYRVDPNGDVEIVIFAWGGEGIPLGGLSDLAVDGTGNVWAASNVAIHRVAPDGTVTSEGDQFHPCLLPSGVAVDDENTVYVSCRSSSRAYKMTTDGTVTLLIDETGDQAGNTFEWASSVAVDHLGNAYVTGSISDNVFRIRPDGTIDEILDGGPGGTYDLEEPEHLTVDIVGNVYVTGASSSNAFRIDTDGTVTEIIDSTGDGAGRPLMRALGIAVDTSGNVYVASNENHFVFKLSPSVMAGRVPDGGASPGVPLIVTRHDESSLRLTWGSSCAATDTSYSVYRGDLGDFSSHTPLVCDTGGLAEATIATPADSSYFLVTPNNSDYEGSLGNRSDGTQRPASTAPCLIRVYGECP
ncbi:MAG: hypothetical protein GY716_09600 [bacterium]|nr:hypothetical protein [bacterium]